MILIKGNVERIVEDQLTIENMKDNGWEEYKPKKKKEKE